MGGRSRVGPRSLPASTAREQQTAHRARGQGPSETSSSPPRPAPPLRPRPPNPPPYPPHPETRGTDALLWRWWWPRLRTAGASGPAGLQQAESGASGLASGLGHGRSQTPPPGRARRPFHPLLFAGPPPSRPTTSSGLSALRPAPQCHILDFLELGSISQACWPTYRRLPTWQAALRLLSKEGRDTLSLPPLPLL